MTWMVAARANTPSGDDRRTTTIAIGVNGTRSRYVLNARPLRTMTRRRHACVCVCGATFTLRGFYPTRTYSCGRSDGEKGSYRGVAPPHGLPSELLSTAVYRCRTLSVAVPSYVVYVYFVASHTRMYFAPRLNIQSSCTAFVTYVHNEIWLAFEEFV